MTADIDIKHDPWDWWQRALVSPDKIGDPSLPLHADSPEVGFFRINSKHLGRWVPVAFFLDAAGQWRAERDGQPVDPDKVAGLWNWACRYPVSYEAYTRAIDGGGWEDEPPHGIGHNLPDDQEMDERERLLLAFQGERDLALEFLKTPITDQASADRAAIWAKRLAAIANRADSLHEVEKRPHLEAGRHVDDKWRDLQQEPAALAKRLKQHQLAFLREQDRLEQERQAAAAAEAARLHREAEAAAAAAVRSANAEQLAEAGRQVAAAKEAEREAEARPVSAGRTGARVSLRIFTFAKIDDWQKLFEAIRDRDEVKALFQTIADKHAKLGTALPGCTIETEKRAV